MTNMADRPNRFCFSHDCTMAAHFGAVYAVLPMHHVKGLDHAERLRVSFLGGLAIELTRSAAIELARRLPEAIASLPAELNGADVSGSVAQITGVDE